MDSAAEGLKNPKGGFDILLVSSRGQSFFVVFHKHKICKTSTFRKDNHRGYILA